MTVQLRLEGNNQTGRSFAEITGSLQGFADKAGVGLNVTKELNKALTANAAKEFRDEVKKAAAELDGTADKMRKVKAEAEAMKAEQNKAAAAAKDSNERHQQSVRATVDVYRVLKDVVRGASQAVQAMAADGNTAAQQLTDAFGETEKALLRIGKNPAAQEGMQRLAQTITRDVNPAISTMGKNFSDNWIFIQDAAGQGLSRLMGAEKEYIEDSKRQHQQFAEDRKAIESKIGDELASKAKSRLSKVRGDALESASVNDITSQEKALSLYEKRIDKIEEIAKDEKLNNDQKAKAIAQEEAAANKLHARLKQLQAEEKQRRKEDEADEIAYQNEAVAKLREREQAEYEIAKAARASLLQRMQDAKASADAEKAAKQEAFGNAGGRDAAKDLLASQDPKKLREQYAQNRMQQARDAAAADGSLQNMTGGQFNAMQQHARKQAFKEFNTGKGVDQRELQQAQVDMLQGTLQSQKGQQEVSGDMIGAMTDFAREQQQALQTSIQQQQQLNAIRQAQQGTANQRQRSQQVGTR